MLGERLKIANKIALKRYMNRFPFLEGQPQHKQKVTGILRKTSCICSCQGCRNPRHSIYYNEIEKLTIQERKDLEKIKEDLKCENL